MKKLFVMASVLVSFMFADVCDCSILQSSCCQAATTARSDGSYSATSQSVTVYTENGVLKGSFTVYLHNSQKYIKFQNTWICIQGKRRFGYKGNWYVIK